jgi:signal transduction histidine kinase
MGAVLDALLDFSRIGRVVTTAEPVDVRAVALQAAEATTSSSGLDGAEVHVAQTLPFVLGDRLRLLDLFIRLVENSLRYSCGQPRPHVEIGMLPLGEEEETAVFYVRDNGVGIDTASVERVFDLFESSDESGGRLGAGLAIARRIVEVHGGRIWLESPGAGLGTTCYFSLPLAAT